MNVSNEFDKNFMDCGCLFSRNKSSASAGRLFVCFLHWLHSKQRQQSLLARCKPCIDLVISDASQQQQLHSTLPALRDTKKYFAAAATDKLQDCRCKQASKQSTVNRAADDCNGILFQVRERNDKNKNNKPHKHEGKKPSIHVTPLSYRWTGK